MKKYTSYSSCIIYDVGRIMSPITIAILVINNVNFDLFFKLIIGFGGFLWSTYLLSESMANTVVKIGNYFGVGENTVLNRLGGLPHAIFYCLFSSYVFGLHLDKLFE